MKIKRNEQPTGKQEKGKKILKRRKRIINYLNFQIWQGKKRERETLVLEPPITSPVSSQMKSSTGRTWQITHITRKIK